MCLIIASTQGQQIEPDMLQRAAKDNPHGIGLSYVENGMIKVFKTFSVDKLIKKLNRSIYPDNKKFVIHFRWGTGGYVDYANCHPYYIQKDIVMCHNGIINIDTPNKNYCDTWHFVKMLRDDGFVKADFFVPENQVVIEEFVGKGNKLVFHTDDDNILIYNEAAGVWRDSVWYSNTHSFKTTHPRNFKNFTAAANCAASYCYPVTEKRASYGMYDYENNRWLDEWSDPLEISLTEDEKKYLAAMKDELARDTYTHDDDYYFQNRSSYDSYWDRMIGKK